MSRFVKHIKGRLIQILFYSILFLYKQRFTYILLRLVKNINGPVTSASEMCLLLFGLVKKQDGSYGLKMKYIKKYSG